MRDDRINKKFFRLLALLFSAAWLSGCPQLREAITKASAKPSPSPSPLRDELAFEPPLPLKRSGSGPVPALHVIGSLSSRDRAGHRRLQLYLQRPAPVEQAFYWQIISLYRSQYDVIWIYTSSQAQATDHWQSKAAWFAPELPKSFHFPGFKPTAEHDGLYWTDAP